MIRPRTFTKEELEAASPLYTERRPVRFQDVDAAGTIFYPRLLEYFSDAYLGLLAAGSVDLSGRIAHGSFRAPIVHAEADFLVPLRFRDMVAVEIAGARLGECSFTLGFRVLRQDGALAAVGHVVYVAIDPVTFKSIRLPNDLRDKLHGAASKATKAADPR
jgi:YbgC/YbaW family acyl-CoA thioester hydrolase